MLLSPPITESSIAEPKREKKWLFTSPSSPAVPSKLVAGLDRVTVTPSGRISWVQMT